MTKTKIEYFNIFRDTPFTCSGGCSTPAPLPGQSQNPCGDNVSLESELCKETVDRSENVPNENWVQHVPEPDIEVQIRILKAANLLHALPADQQPNREAVLKAIGILNEECESSFAKLSN